jgi:hypothetical protein
MPSSCCPHVSITPLSNVCAIDLRRRFRENRFSQLGNIAVDILSCILFKTILTLVLVGNPSFIRSINWHRLRYISSDGLLSAEKSFRFCQVTLSSLDYFCFIFIDLIF